MDVSNLLAITLNKNLKIKVAKWGTLKNYLKKPKKNNPLSLMFENKNLIFVCIKPILVSNVNFLYQGHSKYRTSQNRTN